MLILHIVPIPLLKKKLLGSLHTISKEELELEMLLLKEMFIKYNNPAVGKLLYDNCLLNTRLMQCAGRELAVTT